MLFAHASDNLFQEYTANSQVSEDMYGSHMEQAGQ